MSSGIYKICKCGCRCNLRWCHWFVSYHGDGYYRSTDSRGEGAVFLDRAYCGPEYPYLKEDKE